MNLSIYDNMNEWNKELYKLEVLNNGNLDDNIFKYISKSKLINDFYNSQSNIINVLNKDSEMLFFVKEQTEELCKIAVLKSSSSIRHVKNQTYDLCYLAVESDSSAFEYVDKKLQTTELCIIAIKHKHKIFDDPFNIQYVREDLLTYDLWKIALEHNGMSIKYMDLDYQTYELCLLAVKNKQIIPDESILIYIKSEFHTDELIKLNNDKYSNYYIKNPKYLIDKKISKIINKKIDPCVICHELKKYYFEYECGHLSCFDCKLKNCYYNCIDKPFGKNLKVFKTIPEIDNIYINTDFI